MTITDWLDGRRIGPVQIRVLILMQLLLMIEGLDIQLLGQLTPLILKEWNVTRAAFGPAMAAAMVGLAFGAGLGGKLGDLFGPRRVLMGSALVFALATMAASTADNVAEMTAIRFISGLGFGAASPVSITLVAEWQPRRFQPTAISFMSIGTALGGTVGTLALIALIPALGWRGCFVVCGAVTLLLGAAVFWALPESPVWLASKGRLDAALALLRRHVAPEVTLADIAGEQEAAQAARPAGSVFDRRFRRLGIGVWILFFCTQFIAYSMLSWATTFLTMSRFPMTQALQGSFAFNLFALMATLSAGAMIHWFGSRRVFAVGSLMTFVALVILGMALAHIGASPGVLDYWIVMAGIAGVGVFVSACLATAYAVLALSYPEYFRSTAIGIGLMIGRMGGIGTGLIGGWLLSLSGDSSWPFMLVLIGLSLVAFIGSRIIDRHIPRGGQAA